MADARILFVDNDKDFLDTRKEIMERVGLDVVTASTPEEARRVLVQQNVDLALLDIRLVDDDDDRDMTGLLLAADSAFASIPKIILTAFPTQEYVRLALNSKEGKLPLAVDFVSKLEGWEVMLESVVKALANIVAARARRTDYHTPVPTDGRKVFLINGHDGEARYAVAYFLSMLGLVPVILSEIATDGCTIIELIEKQGNVDFAIAIMTPDDFGGSKKDPEGTQNDRARQNVIFELGYFIGRLDRNRVRALRKEGVEVLSDFHGVLYIPMDSEDGWKLKLARDLRAAGFAIDLSTVV